VLTSLRTARGVIRSLRLYYGDRRRHAAMDALYHRFVGPGDLVFDIGAHVGDRVAAFRRLRARVVAVEPQPALGRALGLIYGHDRQVIVERMAVGREAGTIKLKLNIDNPTVTTASDRFIDAATRAAGWEGQSWSRSLDVPVTTIDRLILRHGIPAFVKIDVEGFEAEALAGLSKPVKALSFEFTTIQRDVAIAAIDRCVALGYARFNAALGESQALVHGAWLDANEIARWVLELPVAANSGDVYAVLG
jgi:FkbM family methyltransferase